MTSNPPLEPSLDRYFRHYEPLLARFQQSLQISKVDLGETASVPGPFLPVFGKNYFSARSRIVFLGIDTKSWLSMEDFVYGDPYDKDASWKQFIQVFQNDLPFRRWGKSKFTFYGFIIGLLAKIHRIERWSMFREDHCKSFLESFAWANEHAIENYESTCKNNGVKKAVWGIVRQAGADAFDGGSVMLPILSPDYIVCLNGSLNIKVFASQFTPINLGDDEFCERWSAQVDGKLVQIIKVRHPNNMRWLGGGHCDVVLDRLATFLEPAQMKAMTPTFINKTEEARMFLKSIQATGLDKFSFVATLATKLRSIDSFMDARSLARLLNDLHITTNRGAEYSGERGTYTLIKGCYMRNAKNAPDVARAVAEAFVRPNGEYAYQQ